MTDQQINKAIDSYCRMERLHGADYCNDRNAMTAAMSQLGRIDMDVASRFNDLYRAEQKKDIMKRSLNARQQSELFVKAIGKWEDGQ